MANWHTKAGPGAGILMAAAMALPAMADGERSSGKGYGASASASPSYEQPRSYDYRRKPYVFYAGGAITYYDLDSNYQHVPGADTLPGDGDALIRTGSGSFAKSDVTPSAYFGVSHTLSSFVIGLELDGTYFGFHRRRDVTEQTPNTYTATSTSARIGHLETLRARLGYMFHNTTLYLTGGFAFGEVDFAQSTNFPHSARIGGFRREMKSGLAIGGGIEHALSRDVSFRAEYLHVDLNDLSVSNRNNCPDSGPPTCVIPYGSRTSRVDYDVTTHIARVGLTVNLHDFGRADDYGAPYKAGVNYSGNAPSYTSSNDGSDRWTGLYISPIAGGISGKTKFEVTGDNFSTGQYCTDGNCGSSTAIFPKSSLDNLHGGIHTVKINGMTLGAVLGYQKQWGNLVLGADVALSGGVGNGKKDCTPDGVGSDPNFVNASALCSSSYVYSTQLRGRVGYANDKWLYYVTGGPAYAKLDSAIDYRGQVKIKEIDSDGFQTGRTSNFDLSTFNERGSSFAKGWVAGAGIEYEVSPGVVFGLSYQHIFLDAIEVDLRRADGTVHTTRRITPDPDVIGSSLKIKLGDTAQAPIAAPPAPATQQVAAAAAPPPAAAPAPAAQPAAATPRPQRPRPAAARPSATPAPAAVRVAPAKPAASPAKPVDGTPTEPAPQMGKPQK